MSNAWIVVALVGVATIAFKAAGPVLVGRRALPPRLQSIVELLAPVMLIALVVTQTFGGDEEIKVDARVVGGRRRCRRDLAARARDRRDGGRRRGDRARPRDRLGAPERRAAVPEHGRRRDRLGDEAHEPDHEKPHSKVPHAALIGSDEPNLEI